MSRASEERQAFRFYVRRDSLRSAEWVVRVGGASSSEVYLSTRTNFGSLKVSLHSSGYCQHGLTKRAKDEMPEDERGALDRWIVSRPGRGRSILAYRIVFPGSELHQYAEIPHLNAVPIPLNSDENQLVVDVLFSAPPFPSEKDWPGGTLGARSELGDGRSLDIRITESPINWGLVAEAMAMSRSGESRPLPPTAYKGRAGYAFGGDAISGSRFAMEVHPRHRPLN